MSSHSTVDYVVKHIADVLEAAVSRSGEAYKYGFSVHGGAHPKHPDGSCWCLWVTTISGERLPLTPALLEALEGWDGVVYLGGSVPSSLYSTEPTDTDGLLECVGLQLMVLPLWPRDRGHIASCDVSATMAATEISTTRPPVFAARARPSGWPM